MAFSEGNRLKPLTREPQTLRKKVPVMPSSPANARISWRSPALRCWALHNLWDPPRTTLVGTANEQKCFETHTRAEHAHMLYMRAFAWSPRRCGQGPRRPVGQHRQRKKEGASNAVNSLSSAADGARLGRSSRSMQAQLAH